MFVYALKYVSFVICGNIFTPQRFPVLFELSMLKDDWLL